MWHQVCLAAFNSLTVFLKEANVPRNGSPVASLLVQCTVPLAYSDPLKKSLWCLQKREYSQSRDSTTDRL